MKAKELMIGDWVYGSILKAHTKVCKIESHKIKAEGYELYQEERYFEPIPLTAEILEKNGLQHHLIAENGFTREEWTLSDDYYDIVVSEWSDSIWVFRYDSTEMNTPHEQRVFSYVHNLQHALRENGIDKYIVL